MALTGAWQATHVDYALQRLPPPGRWMCTRGPLLASKVPQRKLSPQLVCLGAKRFDRTAVRVDLARGADLPASLALAYAPK